MRLGLDVIPERIISALVVLAWLSGCQPTESPPADSRPNILLILADDLGLTDVGFFGGEIPTPNLDALAFEGVRLTNFHVAPSCMQTRAMLMSGMTNHEAGVAVHNDPLRPDVATLPERLRAAGYHTYMAGKWNLGIEASQGPAARGFELSFALLPPGDNHLGASLFSEDTVAYRENGQPTTLPPGWFSSRLYTDKLIEYIDTNAGDGVPWFGYLAFTAPHWPLQAPEDWIDRHAGRYDDGYDVLREARFETAAELGVLPQGLTLEGYRGDAPPWESLGEDDRKALARAMEIYAAMTENMDLNVGRVIDFLDASGQLDNTVILFTSDNGASGSDSSFVPSTIPRTDTDNSLANMGREGSFTAYGRGWAEAATAPYRDVKGSLHSGGTLAATFVHHGAILNKGGMDGTYLTIMDVLPTLVEIAGGDAIGDSFEGRGVLPVRGTSFWGSLTADATGISPGPEPRATPWMTSPHRGAVVRWPWKVISDQRAAPDAPLQWSLFNLEEDAGERHDLSATQSEVQSELVTIWEDYSRGVNVR